MRARHYEELIDGEWVTIGNADFGRIERQQDFLVLALDRAINRTGRNPATLAALIEAGASSIVLDGELTVAELVDIGQAFSDFDPESLQRFGLVVDTVGSGSSYEGEAVRPEVNEPVFDVFRGEADLPAASDVAFELYLSAPDEQSTMAAELQKLGFTVSSVSALAEPVAENVVIHHPDDLAAAETVARWLEPIPRLVEDPDATTISVVLGEDHEQVLFLFPHEIVKMRAAVAGFGDDTGDLPELADAVEVTIPPSTTAPGAAPEPTATSTSTRPVEPRRPNTTTTTTVAATTTESRIIGRAPEGQSCG